MGFLTKIASILKRSGKKGQHTIEYAVLIILIMAGIITMGRYVIRSWNANLKGWEDSVSDSLEDPLLEAPQPPPLGGCTVSGWTEQSCGAGIINYCSGNTVNCAQTEMSSIRSFSPSGCQCDPSYSGSTNTLQCVADSCCCETPVPTGLCSIYMGNPTGLAAPSCANLAMSPTNPDGTCPYGYMGFSTRCGTDMRYGCLQDIFCLNACETETLDVTTEPGGPTVSFTEIADGLTRIVNCPILGPCGTPGPYSTGTCSIMPSQSPRRLCTAGVWGPLQQPCVYTCGDETCDPSVGETCNTCSSDCGMPDAYGNCP